MSAHGLSTSRTSCKIPCRRPNALSGRVARLRFEPLERRLVLNGAPLANDDAYVVAEDSVLYAEVPGGVLANDTDPDGDPLEAILVTEPLHGIVDFFWDGWFAYYPDWDFAGTDSFTYLASDGTATSNVAMVTITVEQASQPPLAADDTYSVPENSVLAISLPGEPGVRTRIYESAPYGGSRGGGSSLFPGQFLGARFEVTSYIKTSRIGGNIGGSNTEGNGKLFAAIVALEGPGDFPDSNFLTTSDVLGTALLDLGSERRSSVISAPISVHLSPGWYALVFGSGRFGATGEGFSGSSGFGDLEHMFSNSNGWSTQVNRTDHFFLDAGFSAVGVLANDVDVNGDAISAQLASPPEHGSVVLNGDGTFVYTPEPNFTGTDSFRYTAHDDRAGGNEATVTIDVGGGNDIDRQAVSDAYSAAEGSSLVVSAQEGLLANDLGSDSSASLVTGPSYGILALEDDGSFTYTPNGEFQGTDSFLYRTEKSGAFSGPAAVTITVAQVNDRPVANDDVYRTMPGETLDVGRGEILASHVYWADGGAVKIGRANLDGSRAENVFRPIAHPYAVAIDPVGGMLYWSSGPADYKIYRSAMDGSQAEAIVTLEEVMDTDMCLPGPGDPPPDPFPPDGDPPLCPFYREPHVRDLALDVSAGKIYWPTSGLNTAPGEIWRANLDGSNQEMIVSGLDQPLALDLDLSAGKVYWTDLATGQIQRANLDGWNVETLVSGLRQPTGIALDVRGGKMYWLSLDTFRDTVIWRAHLDGSDIETVVASGIDYAQGLALDPVQGKIYWADLRYDTINRANLDGTEAEVLVSDGLTNPYGIALDNLASANYSVSLVGNDVDLDGDSLITVLVDGPSHGTLSLNPDASFQYVPDPGFVGVDHYTYKVNDGTVDSEAATVTILVHDVPVATDDAYEVDEDELLVVEAAGGLLANDSYFENVPMSAVLASGPEHGQLTLSEDGSFSYTPPADFHGTDTFTYAVNDGLDDSDPASVTIVVHPVEDAPEAVDDTYSMFGLRSLNVSVARGVLANDADADGDTLTAVLIEPPTHGTLTLDDDGAFTYTPDLDFADSDGFTYRAYSGTVPSNPATVTINLNVPAIHAGDHVLEADTPGQPIEITVTGGAPVSGLNLFVQVGDGGPELVDLGLPAGTDGPQIAEIDLKTGTIFANVPDPQVDGLSIPQVASSTISLSQIGRTVDAEGLLATITVDTTGLFGGTWDLLLSDVLSQLDFGPFDSDFTDIIAEVVDGSLTISAHPGDANGDGRTDVRDFIVWNAHKFTGGTDWSSGDFNGDGRTDVRDFNIWNAHKFTSAPAPVDAALAEANTADQGKSEANAGELAWLPAFEQTLASRRSSDDDIRAELAVDKLLASYWP